MFFGVNPFYNGVLYSLRKKGLSLFRLAKDHKFRLTWFRKLGLVEPPNIDNVRVCVGSEHFTWIFVSFLICKLLWDQ